MNAAGGRLPECCAKTGIGTVIWVEVADVRHLNYEQHISAVPLPGKLDQFPQMLGAPLGGRVRECADAVSFQPSRPYTLHKRHVQE